MTNTPKALFRGAATTNTTTTLYTVPSNKTTTITNILVVNSASSAGTFTMSLDGVAIATAVPLAANSITAIDLKQVLATTKTITGGASATTINFHISGMETA
jgi:hypothetical protein